MPYVITTKRRADKLGRIGLLVPVSRRAVATLEDARSDARATALDHNSIGGAQTAARLPEAGGTIGPLPDGTVIEVAQQADDFDVDAYNARS